MKKSGYDKPIDVAAVAPGTHAGTHEIGFDSAADTITIRHTARSREVLPAALYAPPAGWRVKRDSYDFRDIIGQLE